MASLVLALNNNKDLKTVGSCCGHGEVTGHVTLSDGRILGIYPDRGVYLANNPVRLIKESEENHAESNL